MNGSYQRRTALKTLAGTGLLVSAAGCLGSGNDDVMTLSATDVAWGPADAIKWFMDEHGVIEEEFADIPYDLEWQLSWEADSLFIAGQHDFGMMNPITAARMVTEHDVELRSVGKVGLAQNGMCVQPDSEYDPSSTGGRQETIDRIVEDQATVGINSWASSLIPTTQVIFDDIFGYDFSEDGDLNVTETDYAAMPEQLNRGDLDMAMIDPIVGGPDAVDQVEPVYWDPNMYLEYDLPDPWLKQTVVRQELLDEHYEAVEAFQNAYDRATEWFATSEEVWEEADTNVWGMDEEGVEWVGQAYRGEHLFERAVWFEDAHLSDEDVESTFEMMDMVENLNLVDDGWRDSFDIVQV